MARLEVESWVWYGIVMVIVTARFVARILHHESIKKFELEDYVMILASTFYTFLIAFLNVNTHYPTNLVPPDLVGTIQAEEIPRMVLGSKLVIVVEQFWCATIWGCKACLLLMYYALTQGLWQQILVKCVALYTAVGYVAMEILFFGVWCRPFHNYWSVPSANFQCDTYRNHLIFNLSFNVSSDLAMLCIPLPLLARSQLPLRKKIILCGIFSLGIFVIFCATLSKYYSLHLPYGTEWVNWYVREASVAVIVANIPHCWFLLRKMFNLREFLHNGWDGRRFRRRTPTPPTQNNMVGTGAGARTNTRKGLRRRMSKSGIPASVSEEHIVEYETSGESGGDFRLESWKNRHGSGAESSADDESEGDMPKAESTDAGCFV